tara:strand:+ start:1230 stop:1679 length:450 start_codon:yes stop_codon:yes gene_type:complete
MNAHVEPFFDPTTFTYSYVVSDTQTCQCAVIDSVLDYDPASGRTSHATAQRLVDHVREHDLKVQWLLETHVHADHLSAAPYLRQQLGGQLAIGDRITVVQGTFGKLFNAGSTLRPMAASSTTCSTMAIPFRSATSRRAPSIPPAIPRPA